MKIILTLLLFVHTGFYMAQNLVPNPGFEDTISCPSGIGVQACSDWTYTTQLTPNYFHRCAVNSYNEIPTSSGQEPLSGDAMCAISVFKGGNDTLNFRSYLQVKLDNTLLDGLTYYVSMHVLLRNGSNNAIKEIGAYFSFDSIWENSYDNLQFTPQFEQNSNWLMNNSQWVQISGSFIASGNYNYMIIGNFNTNTNTSSISLGSWGSDNTTYYIDEVCVSSSPSDCPYIASIDEYSSNIDEKSLLYILDSMGRECNPEVGKLLFYVYDDGSVEKRVLTEY